MLTPDRAESCITVPALRVEHWPDSSKSRGQYLPLLELSVAPRTRAATATLVNYLGRGSTCSTDAGVTPVSAVAAPVDAHGDLGSWSGGRVCATSPAAATRWATGRAARPLKLERAADEGTDHCREALVCSGNAYLAPRTGPLCRYWAMSGAAHLPPRRRTSATGAGGPGRGALRPHGDIGKNGSSASGRMLWRRREKAVELEPGNEATPEPSWKIIRLPTADSKPNDGNSPRVEVATPAIDVERAAGLSRPRLSRKRDMCPAARNPPLSSSRRRGRRP
ncbi:MAG: hypothetical protein ACLTSG_14565 [Lachnospiraceae bacterium]